MTYRKTLELSIIHLVSDPKDIADADDEVLDTSFSFAKENSAAFRAVRIAGLSFCHSPISIKLVKQAFSTVDDNLPSAEGTIASFEVCDKTMLQRWPLYKMPRATTADASIAPVSCTFWHRECVVNSDFFPS